MNRSDPTLDADLVRWLTGNWQALEILIARLQRVKTPEDHALLQDLYVIREAIGATLKRHHLLELIKE